MLVVEVVGSGKGRYRRRRPGTSASVVRLEMPSPFLYALVVNDSGEVIAKQFLKSTMQSSKSSCLCCEVKGTEGLEFLASI